MHTKMYSHTQTPRCAHAYNLDGVLIHGFLKYTDTQLGMYTYKHIHMNLGLYIIPPCMKSDMKTEITYKTCSLTITHTMYVC